MKLSRPIICAAFFTIGLGSTIILGWIANIHHLSFFPIDYIPKKLDVGFWFVLTGVALLSIEKKMASLFFVDA